jgi:hypothetical protein
VVAVPTGCRAYWILRTGFGVAFRLIDPAVLQTGCIARREHRTLRTRRRAHSGAVSRHPDDDYKSQGADKRPDVADDGEPLASVEPGPQQVETHPDNK